MTEIGEIISVAVPHSVEDPDCPFCPEEPPPEFTTIPGSKNNSGKLEDNMEEPSSFGVSVEAEARPKLGEDHQQEPPSDPQELKKPRPIHAHSSDVSVGNYSCEAHHLISGKQALAKSEHQFEQWIVANGTIERDTGYSVNNPDNGIWMPSVPENTKPNKWGSLDYKTKKQPIAEHVMKATSKQFHKGPHNIKDAADEKVHETYDRWLIEKLKVMNDRMHGWSAACPLCKDGDESKDKFQPSVRTNQVLDNLSRVARRHITGGRAGWDIFISKLARDYHEPVCPHTRM